MYCHLWQFTRLLNTVWAFLFENLTVSNQDRIKWETTIIHKNLISNKIVYGDDPLTWQIRGKFNVFSLLRYKGEKSNDKTELEFKSATGVDET